MIFPYLERYLSVAFEFLFIHSGIFFTFFQSIKINEQYPLANE